MKNDIISLTCPSCGHTTKLLTAVQTLIEGRKPVCEKCGTQIPVDHEAFKNVAQVFEKLGLGDIPGASVTTTSTSTVALMCPHCGTTSTVATGLAEIEARDKIYCQSCGKEIPIDRAKIHKAQQVIERLGVMSDHDGTETIKTPDGAISVTTKTFDVDVKTDIEPGMIARLGLPNTGAGGTAPYAPHEIKPKSGCFGVMAMVFVILACVLIYTLLG